MSFDIPVTIEPRIQQFAHAQHITTDEAIVRLLDAGLERLVPKTAAIPGLTGTPMSDEDAAVMDEVVEIAMNSRSQRWTSAPRA